MARKYFSFVVLSFLFFVQSLQSQSVQKVAPGIWRVVFGTPEKYLPTDLKEKPLADASAGLKAVDSPPFDLRAIQFRRANGGILTEMTVDSTERFYGFGMQTNTFEQRGMRREIRLNSKVTGNLGLGHASMPFYVSSKGYGVLVNTSRYTTFYMASKGKLDERVAKGMKGQDGQKIALSTVELYGKKYTPSNEVSIHVGGTEGVEIYVFAGREMKDVVQRYNLFSGGGALPPLWGLGFKYRAKATFNEHQVGEITQYFREKNIPCDMLGLEPGWQTTSYPCSFVWNKKNFPDTDAFINKINAQGYKLNLWEHAYTHPVSPIFDSIARYAADYTVWSGAVPDFLAPEGRRIFGKHHEENFVKKGVASFKLDESDGANYELAHREWSFPDIAQFPSGIDGVQMRQIYGHLYNKTLLDLYRKHNKRTLFDVRASYLFSSPYSTALYSDMYGHGDFVRMIANSGFAGVNWSPEIRETANEADLIRRLQTITMSAHMVVNGWYLDLPPWLQFNIKKNSERQLLPNYIELEDKARKLINLRMSLLPYLYTAFARYHFEGLPPFRPLVMDYPADKNVWRLDDQYMMGESIMCAPFIDSASTRSIYFPEGEWYDFNSNKKYRGGQTYTVTMSLDELPMFVKEGTILPLAKPVPFITPETVLSVSCHVYGKPKGVVQLFEDNSYTYDYTQGAYNWLQLQWDGRKGKVERKGKYAGRIYEIKDWKVVGN
jgi:alpha-D-xyloside xylohydrolase